MPNGHHDRDRDHGGGNWQNRMQMRQLCQQMRASLALLATQASTYDNLQFPTDEQVGNVQSVVEQLRTIAGG